MKLGRTSRRKAAAIARVARAEAGADGVRLGLADGRCVQISVQPDHSAEQRVHHSMRRVLCVDLVVSDDHAAAWVRGIGHRRPCTVPVSIATALALVLSGVPATVALRSEPEAVSA